jgi:hypothetical protein
MQAVYKAVRDVLRKRAGGPCVPAVIELTSTLFCDEKQAIKYIARSLCDHFKYSFANAACVEENLRFLHEVLEKMGR